MIMIEPGNQEAHDARQALVVPALQELWRIWNLELSVLAYGSPRKLDVKGCTKECHDVLAQLEIDLTALEAKHDD